MGGSKQVIWRFEEFWWQRSDVVEKLLDYESLTYRDTVRGLYRKLTTDLECVCQELKQDQTCLTPTLCLVALLVFEKLQMDGELCLAYSSW